MQNKKWALTLGSVMSGALLLSCATRKSEVANTGADVVRDPAAENEAHPWTTWSEEPTEIQGLLVLSKIRKGLLNNNLHDPHVDYFAYKPVDCSKTNTQYRSSDGSCTDLTRPMAGAAGVAFGRNIPPEFIDHKGKDKIMNPNPSDVSKVLFTRDEFKPVPFLNMIAAVWIQFMNHDWLTHGKNISENPYQVAGAGDTATVEKTKSHNIAPKHFKPKFGKTTLNDVTHWWDGSQIYGSHQKEQNAVRAFKYGRLKTEKVNGHELLPKDPSLNVLMNKQNQGQEITGFRDNWWVGLSLLHTLFVKEHNAIAGQLYNKYVKGLDKKTGEYIWDEGVLSANGGLFKKARRMNEAQLDEHIFQLARLINAAVMAKIHTVEWTPAILANPTLKKAMFTNWYGLANPQTWSKYIKQIPGLDSTDWFKLKSGYIIGGIVGDKRDDKGVPFSITEEFTSVYRLHSLLPEELEFKSLRNPQRVDKVPFNETRNEKAYGIMAKNELKDLFYSFGTQMPGQLVLNNFPKFMQELKIPGHGTMDLGMVDVMRDRERGVPRYNQFRRAIGLKPIRSYNDFFPGGQPKDARQKEVVEKLRQIYGPNNVEDIDLLVGTLAEEVRPPQFGFGETMFQIFILMASRRLMADRFFTDDYNAKTYTKAGLDWIDEHGTLARVIARHMPELAPKMKGIDTAFYPWKP